MPRNQGFSEPEYSAEYSAEYSVSLPSDPDRGVGRTHEISVRNSGSCLCLPRFMRLTFVPESLENLYQTYFKRQRHETLLVLVVFAALFDCYVVVMCTVVFSSDKLAPLLVAAMGLLLDLLLFVLCKKGLLPDRVTRKVVPYLLWLLITAQIFSYLGLNFSGAHAASDTVGWQAFFVFSFFITLPLSLSPIVIISVVSCVVHTLVLGVTVAQQQQDGLKGTHLLREVSPASGPALGLPFPPALIQSGHSFRDFFSYLGLNFSGAHAASDDTVGWQAFFVFSFFITLPLSLSPIVIISVVSCVVHTLVLGVTVAQQQQDGLKGTHLLRELLRAFSSLLEPLNHESPTCFIVR
ncbi:adenylate cyclase type 3-like [Mustela putorius furo]|uniref:Adenylate cyclase type 3-like n=1 Tax=Mustela putorius furo TaxID=9669 RepID=A0A8U0V275_MUSPF|nr:adenylate cyclase type 3-like [Mustela putorius furo]